jgi:hypothetical protein
MLNLFDIHNKNHNYFIVSTENQSRFANSGFAQWLGLGKIKKAVIVSKNSN